MKHRVISVGDGYMIFLEPEPRYAGYSKKAGIVDGREQFDSHNALDLPKEFFEIFLLRNVKKMVPENRNGHLALYVQTDDPDEADSVGKQAAKILAEFLRNFYHIITLDPDELGVHGSASGSEGGLPKGWFVGGENIFTPF